MSFKVIATGPFERKLKRLAKKYKSLAADLASVVDGARMITYVRIVKQTVFLMDIYDKSEQANISNKELLMLIDILQEEK